MEGVLLESAGCDIDTPRNVTCKQGFVSTYSVIPTGQTTLARLSSLRPRTMLNWLSRVPDMISESLLVHELIIGH
jgi:hypothetical protein